MRKFKSFSSSYLSFFWAIGTFAFLFIIAFVLPRKGFDFTDHGYYLYSSYLTSKFVLPLEGNANFLYAFFIKLGVWNYYFFELSYFLLLTLSMLIFWSSFQPIKRSLFLPVAIIIALSSNFTYMLSYQHAPIVMLMLGFGILFRAIEKNNKGLAASSAVILAYAATTNLALFPTVVTTGILIALVLRQSSIRNIFHLIYWPSAVLLISINILNHSSFSGLSANPNFSVVVLMNKTLQFLWFLIKTNPLSVLFVVGAPLLWKGGRRSTKQLILLTIMLLMLIWFIEQSWWHHTRPHGAQRDVINSSVFYSYFALMCFITYFEFDKFFLRMTLFLIVLISYMTILSITTIADFASHLALAAPASILVGCLILEHCCVNEKIRQYLLIILTVFAALSLYFFAHFNYRSYPLFESKTFMSGNKMFGIAENESKLSLLNDVNTLYEKYDCKNKMFVAYPSLPFLYYYFQREAPLNQPWLSTTVGSLPQNKLISQLKESKHWCVVTALEFNDAPKDFFPAVEKYLKKKSSKIKKIKAQGSGISDGKMPALIVFYSS